MTTVLIIGGNGKLLPSFCKKLEILNLIVYNLLQKNSLEGCMRYFLLTSFIVVGSLFSSENTNFSFDATIPVIDLKDYYSLETKQIFVDQVSKALHEVGFFAVIHTGVEESTLQRAYQASQEFFSGSLEKKLEIYKPSLNGQRGFVPGETAQGAQVKDFKEFVHIGKLDNLWPDWMDLEHPMMDLVRLLDQESIPLQQAFALALGLEEDFFVAQTREGESLLRALHYPRNPDPSRLWAAEHTDIDLFTILPMATEEGLQVYLNGDWIDVKVPPNAFIVNGGDFLQNISNGYFKSSIHRVLSKKDVERYSIVYFIHPRNFDSFAPTPSSIALTGGIQRYPAATRIELLAARLRELGLASKELLEKEIEWGLMDRIQALVDEGVAAEPVVKTYSIWRKMTEM